MQLAVLDHRQHGADDPAIDARHEVIAFGGADESRGRHRFAVGVDHAQQNFRIAGADAGGREAGRALDCQLQSTLVDRAVEARRPVHFFLANIDLRVGVGIDLDPVTPLVLGGIAGEIRQAHDRGDVVAVTVDRDQADADADLETTVALVEADFANRLAQLFGALVSVLYVAAFEQNAEFVATEARQHIAAADVPAHGVGDFAKQLVAGDVPAGIVDDLELVEIEKQQRMVAVVFVGTHQQLFCSLFERMATGKAGQIVMIRAVRQFGGRLLRAHHVAQDKKGDDQQAEAEDRDNDESRQMGMPCRQRDDLLQRDADLYRSEQLVQLPLFAGLEAGGNAAFGDLGLRFVRIVALHAGLGRGGIGAQVFEALDAVDFLESPHRLPVDRLLRIGPILPFELAPGPALEFVVQTLGRLEVPLAERLVAEQAVALAAGLFAEKLEELCRQRHIAGLLLPIDMRAEAVLLHFFDDVFGINRTCARRLAGDDLGQLDRLEFDRPLLPVGDQLPGRQGDGDHEKRQRDQYGTIDFCHGLHHGFRLARHAPVDQVFADALPSGVSRGVSAVRVIA